jgi:hypothetical protein
MGVALAVVIGIEIALIAAVVSGKGRHFAAGFVATIISFGLVSRGFMIVVPWGMPVVAAYQALKPASKAPAAPGDMSRREWLKIRRGAPPSAAQAELLARTVNECAAKYRAVDPVESYPRDADQLQMVKCERLAATRADSATTPPRYADTDFGWRWTYTPAAQDSAGRVSHYSVRISEDRAIGRVAPQYGSDETGVIKADR